MRTAPPDLPGRNVTESPLDRAMSLMLAGERDAALRWCAAVVKHDASLPSALILTSRLLADANRTEAAIEGFELSLRRAIDAGNLPLAVAALSDLRALGRDTGPYLDEISQAFCAGSSRLSEVSAAPPPPLPDLSDFQPLSSHLTGPALLSKATEIVHEARKAFDELDSDVATLIAPIPLFSSLEQGSLRALIECFEMLTVPAGHAVISQGEEGGEAYIVARGELEVRRHVGEGDEQETLTLARLTNGVLFGEMALLSRAPRAASVVACQPSILLVARREALEAVAEKRNDVGVELAAHCRRRMVANLIRTSEVLLAVPPDERQALVERFETRVFEKGDKLIAEKQDTSGLHIIASGEVAVVGHEENNESFVISTLGVGEVVGEVALVLRRKANADVVAVMPTVSLHLPREDFMTLVRLHPSILASLYLRAVERDEETKSILTMSTTTMADGDEYVLI